MASAFVKTTPTEYVPGGAGSFYDIDCSALVPAGAVGVLCELQESSSFTRSIWLRKNGSVDELYEDLYLSCMTTMMLGVDANRVFEAKVESTSYNNIYVRGYFLSGYVFRTDQQAVTTETTGSYVDVNCSSYCPSAVMVIFNFVCTTTAYYGVVRKNGSSDDRYASSDKYYNTSVGEFVGCDASQIVEQKIENAAVDLYIIGYYAPPGTASCPVVMHTNATYRSLSTTGSYQDLAALPTGALYGFYSANSASSTAYATWFRKNGSTDNLYSTSLTNIYGYSHSCWVVECDTGYVVEQEIESANIDTYELGYGLDVVQYTKDLTGTVTATGSSVVRAAARAITGTAAAAGTLTRQSGKVLAGAVGTTGTITYGFALSKVLTATVEAAGALVRGIARTISGAVSTDVTIPRATARAVAGSVDVQGSLLRSTGKNTSLASVATEGTLQRITGRNLTAEVGAVGTVERAVTWLKALAGTVEAVGVTVARAVARTVSGTVGTSGSVPRAVARSVAATVSTIGTVKRDVAKVVATATSEVIGAITYLKTWAEEYFGGVEAVATVKRDVFRAVTAAVNAVGTVATTLYDIVYAMNQTIRRVYAKVQITYTDPFFSAGIATAATEVGDYTYTEQTTDNVTTEEYPWFSLHRNDLTGFYHPLPGNQEYSVGWWGTQLSDSATHVFSVPYPLLTITHAARSIETLYVVGDDQLGEYPVDFTVKLYDVADNLLHTETVTGNGFVSWQKDIAAHANVTKQTLEITKWSRGNSVVKIAQFFTTLEETYLSEDGDLVSIQLTEAREFEGTTVPLGNSAASEIRVKLNNIDGTFDPGNFSSRLYGMLLNNRAIKAWLGVDLIPSGVRRWYPLGTFYSRDWDAPANEIWAEVSGQDMLARLQATTFSTSEVYESKTLEELAIIVMTDAGLTAADWSIAAGYAAVTVPYAWFNPVSHREALRLIAAAALGQCYCDRDGKVVLDIYTPPALNAYAYTTGNVFDISRPLAWSQMVNRVEAQAQPRTADVEQDIVNDSEAITVPAGSSVTKTHFFLLTPCIDVLAPTITGGADITVTDYTAYAWGIMVEYTNAGAGDEDVTNVTVRGKPLIVMDSRVVVAEDALSIARNGIQSAPEIIASEFWQSSARAQEVADSLLDSFKNPRRDVMMRARGNIAQLLGDRVWAPDSWYAETQTQFGIVGQDITFDGGLEVMVYGKQLALETEKELTAEVGTLGTISSSPVALKSPTSATASTVGSIARSILKTILAEVGTLGTVMSQPTICAALDAEGLYDSDSVFNTAWTKTTGGANPYIGMSKSTSYFVQRGLIVFDSSSIPAGATITSAEVWLWAVSKTETAGAYDLVVQNGQPTYPHNPIVSGDFNKANYSGDGGSLASSGITVDAWVKIPLNATGLTWIQKEGTTKLCIRTSLDIAGTAPASGKSSTVGYHSRVEGYAHPPILVVEWTL